MTTASPQLRPPYPALTWNNVRAWSGLVTVLAVRNFKVRYLRVRVALLWPLVQPVVQGAVLALVFVRIFGIRGIEHYPLYVLSGVMAWQLFQASVTGSMTAALDNGALVKKVPVPTVVFPLAATGGALLVFGIQSVLLLGGSVVVGTLGWQLLLWPLAVLLQLAVGLGTGMLVGAFLPAVRELRIATESALLLLFYASPVLYEPSRLPEPVREWVRLNPMDGVLQLHRGALLGREVDVTAVLVSVVVAVPMLAVGHAVYRRRARVFADLV
jgi:ABC-2 type transport system permease protein